MKKVDEGSELIYWNLSYRRKFIRTLWWVPMGIGAAMIWWFMFDKYIVNIIITLAIIVTFTIQLIYTYSKWKKEEKNTSGN